MGTHTLLAPKLQRSLLTSVSSFLLHEWGWYTPSPKRRYLQPSISFTVSFTQHSNIEKALRPVSACFATNQCLSTAPCPELTKHRNLPLWIKWVNLGGSRDQLCFWLKHLSPDLSFLPIKWRQYHRSISQIQRTSSYGTTGPQHGTCAVLSPLDFVGGLPAERGLNGRWQRPLS